MTTTAVSDRPSWGLAEGDELVPGRTVLDTLGGGSRYEALLVWDDRLHALMVAKVLRPHLLGDARAVLDLAAEGEALDALAHPILLRGFDAVIDSERPHLLVEHLEGPTLRRVIRQTGPLGLEQLLPLALHLASALHYLHGAGWVHLDVKPDNVILGVPPRLIDLSVARPLEAAAVIGSPVGTDAYMAPEQCDPAAFPGAIGPAADVFGLGATLQHAWTGHRPFARVEGDRYPQLWAAPRPLASTTPSELADVIGAALDPDPASRPTPAQVVTTLEPLVASLPRKLVLTRGGMRPVA